MHGHGYVPPPPSAPSAPSAPSTGAPVTMRVLFVVLAALTCGLLAWAAMLRLALVTRAVRDWVLFVAVVGLDVLAVVLIGVDKGDEEFTGPGNTGMTILVATLVPVIAYYLTMDIRHHARLARARAPYQQTQFPAYPPPQHQPSYGYPTQSTPAPAPGPAPARIDQVRAELDELSDYLRKQEGGS
ncbi:hypothetical protein [Streptomyces spectabilis]|uniref:Integral membrane protein n=1 Tax=Streptomyces spectabilis TaxID=68270 RepID=A0A5P2X9T0_STRST|nr:hypothetical protein [Streptomyces spectabilis]MBB5107762.1 hypothetical protein [Streptomyces spectabilis]MCI3903200.1 hypothetical protein [Streptomyces spectabilis]QEV60434.1 hypothetical protein CP982_18305 [Streptomyces spectabilis]GGV38510.1 hypothetical protein GCM10010245_61070 [Streptomyces spectabilis]